MSCHVIMAEFVIYVGLNEELLPDPKPFADWLDICLFFNGFKSVMLIKLKKWMPFCWDMVLF